MTRTLVALLAFVSCAAFAQAPAGPVRIRGTIEKLDGPMLTVTAVVSYAPTDRGALKPGAAVFINSEKQADGGLATARVNVGLNGQTPPM